VERIHNAGVGGMNAVAHLHFPTLALPRSGLQGLPTLRDSQPFSSPSRYPVQSILTPCGRDLQSSRRREESPQSVQSTWFLLTIINPEVLEGQRQTLGMLWAVLGVQNRLDDWMRWLCRQYQGREGAWRLSMG